MKISKRVENYYWFFCILLTLLGIGIQCFYTVSMNLWVDEVFSLRMLEHSYVEMVQLTAIDVHPPLYYLISKFGISVFCSLSDNINIVYAAKFISVIPFMVMFLLGITKVCRLWGKYVSGLFILSLISMPQLITYGVEIRMYSWAMLFVIVSYLFVYDLIMDITDRKAWGVFVISSLMAAYTHYFACVAVAVLYIGLGIFFLLKNHGGLKYRLAASMVTVIGYLPWAFVLLRQIIQVKKEYWISPITRYDLIQYVKILFGNYVCFGFIVLLILCLLLYSIKKHDMTKDTYYAILGVAVTTGTIVIGVGVSKIMRPVFVIRYAIPSMMCLWLGSIISCNLLKNLIVKTITVIGVLAFCTVNIGFFVISEEQGKEAYENMLEFTGRIEEDALVIVNEEHIQQVLTEYIPNTCFLWKDDLSNVTLQVYQNHVSSLWDVKEIKDALYKGHNVYFVDGINIPVTESLDEALGGTDIRYELLGKYHVECDCIVYELTLEES